MPAAYGIGGSEQPETVATQPNRAPRPSAKEISAVSARMGRLSPARLIPALGVTGSRPIQTGAKYSTFHKSSLLHTPVGGGQRYDAGLLRLTTISVSLKRRAKFKGPPPLLLFFLFFSAKNFFQKNQLDKGCVAD